MITIYFVRFLQYGIVYKCFTTRCHHNVKQQVVCKSDNFRAITLSSIIGKVLNWIFLIKEQNSLCTSDLQFGFKQGVSTTNCTYVVNETISHYNFNRTNVHVPS